MLHRINLSLEKDTLNNPISISIDGIVHHLDKSELLDALFQQHTTNVYYADKLYKIILHQQQPPVSIKCAIQLDKELVARYKYDKDQMLPSIVFRPDEQYETFTPFIKYIANPKKNITTVYSVMSPGSILGKSVLKGAFGKVITGLMTLKKNTFGKWILNDNKKRVMKITKDGKESREEAENLAQMKSVTSKIPTIINDEGFHVQSHAKGVLLQSIIDNANTENKTTTSAASMTLQMRYRLTVALLQAYIEQVEDRGLTHRDIKPGNIHVYIPEDKNQNIEVKIYDAGLSTQTISNVHTFAGTPGYVAPEIYQGEQSSSNKLDVYSLGVVIRRLWGADFEKGKPNKRRPILGPLFAGTTEDVQSIIDSMRDNDPDSRITASEALRRFTKSYLSHSYRSDPENLDDFYHCAQVGYRAQKAILQLEFPEENIISDVEDLLYKTQNLEQSENRGNLSVEKDKLDKVIAEYKNLLSSSEKISARLTKKLSKALYNVTKYYNNLKNELHLTISPREKIIEILDKALDEIKDSPVYVEEFLTNMRIKALQGEKNKEGILQKANEIFDQATHNIESIYRLRDVFSCMHPPTDDMQLFLIESEAWLAKYAHKPFSLDSLAELSQRFSDKVKSYDKDYSNESIENLVAVQSKLSDLQNTLIKYQALHNLCKLIDNDFVVHQIQLAGLIKQIQDALELLAVTRSDNLSATIASLDEKTNAIQIEIDAVLNGFPAELKLLNDINNVHKTLNLQSVNVEERSRIKIVTSLGDHVIQNIHEISKFKRPSERLSQKQISKEKIQNFSNILGIVNDKYRKLDIDSVKTNLKSIDPNVEKTTSALAKLYQYLKNIVMNMAHVNNSMFPAPKQSKSSASKEQKDLNKAKQFSTK